MKNRTSKLIYGLLVPAMVALLAIACNASAVWGSSSRGLAPLPMKLN